MKQQNSTLISTPISTELVFLSSRITCDGHVRSRILTTPRDDVKAHLEIGTSVLRIGGSGGGGGSGG